MVELGFSLGKVGNEVLVYIWVQFWVRIKIRVRVRIGVRGNGKA